jgi:hypothetical protein
MSLHPHLDDDDRRGVLIEAAGGSVVALGVDMDKWLQSGRKPLGLAL